MFILQLLLFNVAWLLQLNNFYSQIIVDVVVIWIYNGCIAERNYTMQFLLLRRSTWILRSNCKFFFDFILVPPPAGYWIGGILCYMVVWYSKILLTVKNINFSHSLSISFAIPVYMYGLYIQESAKIFMSHWFLCQC